MAEANGAKTPLAQRRFQHLTEKLLGPVKISFLLLSGFHLAKVIIGAIHLQHCPVEPQIPKFLIALGALGLATKIVTLLRDFLIKYTKVGRILSLIATIELALFITCSYYVYREFKPRFEPLDSRYCNKTLYLFAFTYITILYAVILLIIVGFGCFILSLILLDKYVPKDSFEDTENTTTELTAKKELQKLNDEDSDLGK